MNNTLPIEIYQSILRSSTDSYLILTPDLTIMDVSAGFMRITDTKREDILGRYLFEVFPPNAANASTAAMHNMQQSCKHVLETGHTDHMPILRYDLCVTTPAGNSFSERHWKSSNSPVFNDKGEVAYILTHSEDVTEITLLKKKYGDDMNAIQDSLLQKNQKLRTIFDCALDAIVCIDQNSNIIEWNKQAEKIFGWSAQEALNQRMPEMIIPLQYRQRHYDGLARFLKSHNSSLLNTRIELQAQNRQNITFPIEFAMSCQRVGDQYQFTAFIRDISARKEAEKQIQHYTKELEYSNQELNDFAYIVSHDLKEPLRGLQSFAQFLLEDYCDKLDQEGLNKLQTISGLSVRMGKLLDSLLYYSKLGRTALATSTTDMNAVLQGALEVLAISLKEKNVTIKVPQTLPTLDCDCTRIGEVFQNLIGNAIKYNDGEQNQIEIGFVKNHPRAPHETVFYVRDHGIGIPEKHLETVFKMFKRLHPKDAYNGGTGSGLAICKKIIQQHHGDIWAESAGSGKGTTFFFTLPQHSHATKEHITYLDAALPKASNG